MTPDDLKTHMRIEVDTNGLAATAAKYGVSKPTIVRAVAGLPLRESTAVQLAQRLSTLYKATGLALSSLPESSA